jgi:hypothetical protein
MSTTINALDVKQKPEKFLLLESTQIPLFEVQNIDDLPNSKRVLANMVDPTTNLPYANGMILSGIFADLNPQPNNNNRVYDIPEYIELIEKLYNQIFSKRGVFGEFEHPKKYATYGPRVTHKLLDIFYDPDTKLVMGSVLVLDTPNGKIVKEIIKSGGQVCISARAAGYETKQADGTLKAVTKLLVTYDLVMNPGFVNAELNFSGKPEDYQHLYESIKLNVKPFSVLLKETQLSMFNSAYSKYISLNENLTEGCYIQWFSKLYESNDKIDDELTPTEANDLQLGDSDSTDKKQEAMEFAAKKELKQCQNKFFKESNKRLGNTFYDNSAGFMRSQDLSIDINQSDFKSYNQSLEDADFDNFLDKCRVEDMELLQAQTTAKKSENNNNLMEFNPKKDDPKKDGTKFKVIKNTEKENKTHKENEKTKIKKTGKSSKKTGKTGKSKGFKEKNFKEKVKHVGEKVGKNAKYYLNLEDTKSFIE